MSDASAAGFPWPPASATGIGSLPGTVPAEAMRVVFGELPGLPHLAELPARGPGADLIGRTAAMLVELPVETTPRGWRFAGRPGRDLSRARGMLTADLDALEEVADGYRGPLKIQVCGPWTLAAAIELTRSADPALADPGAVADLAASLSEGVRAHVEQVGRRVPGAAVILQVDEPSLPAVLAGAIPTASGLYRLPPPEPAQAQARLRELLAATPAFTIVHCCAATVPFGSIQAAGADAVSFDLAVLPRSGEEGLAGAVESGLGILAGVVPAVPGRGQASPVREAGRPPAPAREVAQRVARLWSRMGWPVPRQDGWRAGPDTVSRQVVLTPSCGLAGATDAYARSALARCREAAGVLTELIEEQR